MLRPRGLFGWWWRALLAWALAGPWAVALAQHPPGPPALVGQLAATEGTVWLYDRDPGDWRSSRHEPLVNRPLTSGDRLRTDSGARALVRVASVTVRLGGDTELELARVEAGQLVFRLWRGRASWHVLDDTQAGWLTLLGEQARVLPQRAGHYRLDQAVAELRVGVWRGEARVLPEDGEFTVKAGRQASLVVDGPPGHWRVRQQPVDTDAFADWVLRDAADDAAPQTARQIGDTLSGWQSLERHGRWREDPEWGWLWVPSELRPGWQPYRDGRWVWVSAWGWTWVDAAPWGFVTVHYGRWIPWRGGWAWQPSPRHERPVFSPVPPALRPPVLPPPPPRASLPAPPPPPQVPPPRRLLPMPPVSPPPRPPVTEVPDKPVPRVPGYTPPRPPEPPARPVPVPSPRPPSAAPAPAPAPAQVPAPGPAVSPVAPTTPPAEPAPAPRTDRPRPTLPPAEPPRKEEPARAPSWR